MVVCADMVIATSAMSQRRRSATLPVAKHKERAVACRSCLTGTLSRRRMCALRLLFRMHQCSAVVPKHATLQHNTDECTFKLSSQTWRSIWGAQCMLALSRAMRQVSWISYESIGPAEW